MPRAKKKLTANLGGEYYTYRGKQYGPGETEFPDAETHKVITERHAFVTEKNRQERITMGMEAQQAENVVSALEDDDEEDLTDESGTDETDEDEEEE